MSDSAGGSGNTWAQYLKSARRAKGLTIDDLATLAGVSRMTIIRWEAGVSEPKPTTLRAVARALGLPLGDVLTLAGGADEGALDPLAAEVISLIGPDSLLADRERALLREMISRLIEPYRHSARRRGRG